MQNPNNQPSPYGPLQNENPFSNSLPVAAMGVEDRLDFIRRTYSLFMLGILTALLVGCLTANVFEVQVASEALWRNPLLSIGLLFGLTIGAQAVSRVPGLNYVALFGFTGFIGFWLTPMLIRYDAVFPGIVSQAGVLTTIVFGALTAYAFISKKDFSFLGGILFVAMIGLVLGGLANVFFFKSSMASYLMAWVSLTVFSGFVLYDTSNIMRTHDKSETVSAALGLFLNFLNMFLAILRILSGSRSSD